MSIFIIFFYPLIYKGKEHYRTFFLLLFLVKYNLYMRGKLTVYYGPMYSGKSWKMINDYKAQKEIKIAVKPKGDLRTEGIYSRRGIEIPAVSINDIKELKGAVRDIKHIFIDEIFFFSGSVVETLDELLKGGANITVAGLDNDYRGEPFELMTKLIQKADYKKQLKAICHITGEEAIYTGKLVNKKVAPYHVKNVIESDVIGETEVEYIAVSNAVMNKWREDWGV